MPGGRAPAAGHRWCSSSRLNGGGAAGEAEGEEELRGVKGGACAAGGACWSNKRLLRDQCIDSCGCGRPLGSRRFCMGRLSAGVGLGWLLPTRRHMHVRSASPPRPDQHPGKAPSPSASCSGLHSLNDHASDIAAIGHLAEMAEPASCAGAPLAAPSSTLAAPLVLTAVALAVFILLVAALATWRFQCRPAAAAAAAKAQAGAALLPPGQPPPPSTPDPSLPQPLPAEQAADAAAALARASPATRASPLQQPGLPAPLAPPALPRKLVRAALPNIYNGEHHVQFGDGSAYYGEWRGGRMHGRGVFVWPTGELLAPICGHLLAVAWHAAEQCHAASGDSSVPAT